VKRAAERIVVCVTADEKTRIARRACDAGLSMSEFFRLAATKFDPAQDVVALDWLAAQVKRGTESAIAAIDETLRYVEISNQRIAIMEAAAFPRG
jgi:hypothetical protein